ncbi:MAG: class I SAM-dependent methyltransferase [Deltaproteobacteria bacterium]|nr:class I SAM-dependent methyltransferase [Deltaproteobacteria bacterium]
MATLPASLKSILRTRVQRSYPLTCGKYMARNLQIQLREAVGDWSTDRTGVQNTERTVADAAAYVDEVFEDYKTYGGVRRFHGRVAEVGPGDNCGVGLRFLLDGAEAVDLVDRFDCARDLEKNAALYRLLEDRARVDGSRVSIVDGEPRVRDLRWHRGPKAAVEEFFSTPNTYDWIVSRAVLEHVNDPATGLRRMAAALRPGGMLLHKVDLRDHNMFSGHFHDLKFLEVPEPVYFAMTHRSGFPNRVLANVYRDTLQSLPNLDVTMLVTHLAGVGPVTPHVPFDDIAVAQRERALSFVQAHRHRFAAKFAAVSDAELATAGLFIVATKR